MRNKVCWIDVISYDDADAELKGIYNAVRGPDGNLDNLYQASSLRPHMIKPADDLYLAALHNVGNHIPKWFSELIGSFVAILTGCNYALTHHGHNFACLLDDRERAEQILKNLESGDLADCGDDREVSALRYVKTLCLEPEQVTAADIERLSTNGWSDGEILEIIQVAATFSYFVRVINGLGITVEGERTGL